MSRIHKYIIKIMLVGATIPSLWSCSRMHANVYKKMTTRNGLRKSKTHTVRTDNQCLKLKLREELKHVRALQDMINNNLRFIIKPTTLHTLKRFGRLGMMFGSSLLIGSKVCTLIGRFGSFVNSYYAASIDQTVEHKLEYVEYAGGMLFAIGAALWVSGCIYKLPAWLESCTPSCLALWKKSENQSIKEQIYDTFEILEQLFQVTINTYGEALKRINSDNTEVARVSLGYLFTNIKVLIKTISQIHYEYPDKDLEDWLDRLIDTLSPAFSRQANDCKAAANDLLKKLSISTVTVQSPTDGDIAALDPLEFKKLLRLEADRGIV